MNIIITCGSASWGGLEMQSLKLVLSLIGRGHHILMLVPEKTTCYMPQEYKDNVIFPQGYYWVYEDSITGNIEGVLLKENNISNFNPVLACNCLRQNL